MEQRHEDMIVSTATNVEWLVEAHKENIKKREKSEERIGSLEKTRARAKGAGIVAGAVASFSGIAYKIFGG